ncbi:MAG: carbohydrate-binding domain-containing protein [Clostridiales bacterium]|nr:carbohydrate-binding domain-containing protein [Clostridiales bacterium]
MRKRIISLLAAFCMLLTLLPVTGAAENAMTLTKTVIGNTGATIAVSGGSGTVTAVSSNESIATVEVNGTVVRVNGVSGKKGVVTITVTRGGSTADMEVAVGYTAFRFDGRTVTVYEGSDTNFEVVAIEQSSDTGYAAGTDAMSSMVTSDGGVLYTAADGYDLLVSIKNKGGTYVFGGTTENGAIAVKKGATKDATLLLDGLTLKSDFTAALTIKKDSTAAVYLHTLGGTVNTLSDTAMNNADVYGDTTEDGGDGTNAFYAESAVIKGKTAANLTISGNGVLNVVANAKNGVKIGENGFLTIAESTVSVTAPNSALSTENEMLISGGNITLTTTEGDAIKAENDAETLGTVYITGGTITANSADEGILARGLVNISGGVLNITCAGDAIKAEDGADTPTYGDITISGGDFTIVSSGDGVSGFNVEISGGTFDITCANGYTNTSYNKDTDPSAKGLKAELELLLKDGDVTISAPDDAIHSDGNITFEGGSYKIWTRDDGVHADQELTFGMRGAPDDMLNLRVNTCYEGMEGADIVLNSGYATVYATDDVINAANKNLSNYHYTINEYGGVYRLYTSGGDGVDSNGGCYFRGGDLEVYSASNTSNDPLDTEDTLALYGGITLACGMNQMQGSPSAGIYVEFTNLSIRSGYSIVIKDGSGNVLKSTQAYFASSSNKATYIVFSHPALVSGSTYYLYINGSSSAKTGTATGTGVDSTQWADLEQGNTNVYERVTSMTVGSRYIITNASASTSVSTLAGSTAVSAVTSTLSTVTGGYSFGTVNENNTWYTDASGHLYTTVGGTNYYLMYTSSSSGWSSSYTIGMTTDVTAAASWAVEGSGSAAKIYTTATSSGGGGGGPTPPGQSTKVYLYYSGGWKLTTSSATVYVYAPAVAQAALTGSLYYVAETDENFAMSDVMAGTSIVYRSGRSAATQSVEWSSSHITYSWEPALDSSVVETYVMTVMYDGIAFGTVTVRILGDNESVTITFIGDYTGTVEIAKGETVPLPEAPDGFSYIFLVNGEVLDASAPVYENMTILVVLDAEEQPVQATLPGDVNCDGVVNFDDISVLYAYTVNKSSLTPAGLLNADVNGDGVINTADISELYKLILNLN